MVIGNGLIASAFSEYENDPKRIIFASGVSNSSEQSEKEFNREKELLIKILKENKEKIIVYFSSFISNDTTKQRYIQHKKTMENILKESTSNYYCILKLPQVIGKTGNKTNLFHYLVDNIRNDKLIRIYKDSYRSLLDVDDVKRIVDILQSKWGDLNTYMQFPGIEILRITDIVSIIANELNKIPNIELIDKDDYVLPEKSVAVNIIIELLEINSVGYTQKIVKKYLNE